ncbi:gamma carbonic anhydrase family protein [bacterium]|nr:MAG: gamma carbonic anhydrase family protein [bacterium]
MTFSERIDCFLGANPRIAPSSYIAAGATVVGDVTLGEESSVWFGAVLRGDINFIEVGARSNIQDGAVIHVADAFGARIGELVTVGHRAIVHACTVEDEVLVGMGAIVMDGAHIGTRSIIGAGALVTGGTHIPAGSLVLGSPAKVVRVLAPQEQEAIQEWALRYVALSRRYMEQR